MAKTKEQKTRQKILNEIIKDEYIPELETSEIVELFLVGKKSLEGKTLNTIEDILIHICDARGIISTRYKNSSKRLKVQLATRLKKEFATRRVIEVPPAPTRQEVDGIIATITEHNIPEDWINDNSQKMRKMIMVVLESDLEWRECMYMLIVDDFEDNCYVEKWGKETSIIRCILGHAEMKVSRY